MIFVQKCWLIATTDPATRCVRSDLDSWETTSFRSPIVFARSGQYKSESRMASTAVVRNLFIFNSALNVQYIYIYTLKSLERHYNTNFGVHTDYCLDGAGVSTSD